jgi:hypothetical protein
MLTLEQFRPVGGVGAHAARSAVAPTEGQGVGAHAARALKQAKPIGQTGVAAAPDEPRSSRPKAGSADINASFWTLRDLAVVFDRRDIAAQVAHWRKRHGFPAPLPWSARPLKWRPAPVLAWKAAREAENG